MYHNFFFIQFFFSEAVVSIVKKNTSQYYFYSIFFLSGKKISCLNCKENISPLFFSSLFFCRGCRLNCDTRKICQIFKPDAHTGIVFIAWLLLCEEAHASPYNRSPIAVPLIPIFSEVIQGAPNRVAMIPRGLRLSGGGCGRSSYNGRWVFISLYMQVLINSAEKIMERIVVLYERYRHLEAHIVVC